MKNILLIILALLVLGSLVFVLSITRDGELITPIGAGTITIDGRSYEAFPLPDYAAEFVTDDYKSYFVEVEPGIKIHMLEVGTGLTVYLQHGNPTSGFLYRKVVNELPLDRVRVIMPTMVGLGFSSKVPASEHKLDNHVRWMTSALEQLQLEGLIYVGQDWGGPVGMGTLANLPDLLQGLVAMNTGFTAPTEQLDLSNAHATVKTPVVGELIIEVTGAMFEGGLRDVQGDPDSIPQAVSTLYGQPLLDSGNAKAPLALMRMVPDGPNHPSAPAMRTIETYAHSLAVPVELVWGMSDPILGEGLAAIQTLFPNARVTKTDAGHFLQEEVPVEIAAAVMRLVDRVTL
jgi:haloalkane dehalogenase